MLTRLLQPCHWGHDGVVLDSTDLLSWTWQAGTDLPSVVLLHGSGQDERTLLALAQAACAGHTLTAVRGRIPLGGRICVRPPSG